MNDSRNIGGSRIRGISLTEGLVSLLVLTFGLLAIFNFQAGLLSAGSDAKARTEALQIADSKLGHLRTAAVKDMEGLFNTQALFVTDATNVFGTSSTRTESVSGTNANFSVAWAATNLTGPVRKNVLVTVTWTDRDGSQQVKLAGDVRWSDPVLGLALLAGTLPGGGTISPPTGDAEYGDDVADYTPGSIPGTANTNDDGTSDGTYTYYNASTGKYELIDSTGKILLFASSAFGTISGRIYLSAGDYSQSLVNEVYAGAPDISVCTTTRTLSDGTLYPVLVEYDPVTNLATGDDAYYYVNYTCYMGSGWFGSIGIIMDDGSGGNSLGPNDRGCVGDPAQSDSGHDDSKHPQLEFTRVYRGYEEIVNADGDPLIDVNGNRLYNSSGMSSGQQLAGDSFLITSITGTATDGDCLARLDIDTSATTGTQPEFTNNVGKFVCLSLGGCPSTLPVNTGTPVASIATRTVSGTISPDSTVTAVSTSDGDACTVTSNSYSCSVYDLGAGWSGYIAATAAGGRVVSSANPRYYTGANVVTTDLTGQDFTTIASGTPHTLSLTGSITNVGDQVTLSSFALDDGGTCSFTSTAYACTSGSFTTSWNAVLTIGQNKTLCDDGVTVPSAGIVNRSASTITFTGTTSTSVVKDITVAKNFGACP